jgi:hypothetical protein
MNRVHTCFVPLAQNLHRMEDDTRSVPVPSHAINNVPLYLFFGDKGISVL